MEDVGDTKMIRLSRVVYTVIVAAIVMTCPQNPFTG